MDEKKIRQIVQEELKRNNNAARFGVNNIPFHTHDGINSPQIKEENVIPSVSVSGRITFAQITDYTLNLNASFTPTHIMLYGIAYNPAGSVIRAHVIGTANLGPSFYFQPGTTESTITGDIQYPFVDPNLGVTVPLQSSSFFLGTNGSTTFRGQPGEGHILDVQYAGTVYARMTVTEFNKNRVVFRVSYLETDWEIYTNIVIT
jgi:hypothetical protein